MASIERSKLSTRPSLENIIQNDINSYISTKVALKDTSYFITQKSNNLRIENDIMNISSIKRSIKLIKKITNSFHIYI